MAAGGQQVAAVLGRNPGGLVAVKGRGKRERGSRGTCSPPRFGPGRSEEVGPRRRAASDRGERGGGAGARVEAVRQWRRLWSGGAALGGPFKGVLRRWSGRGGVVPPG